MLMSLSEAYPVESKPLNNNPETWNFGDGWLLSNPRNEADPSASALIASDPHVKKSKITPKSIFIAPSSYIVNEQLCPNGFRVDDNGKCIKTVMINQDEILVARISELFGSDKSPNKNTDIDSDYYDDFADDSKSEQDSGPLQFNLPLTIDIEEEGDGKKVEYIIAENFTVRSLNPKDLITTTEKIDETTTAVPVTESTQSVFTEEPITNITTMVEIVDEIITTTETTTTQSSTVKDDDDDETTNSTMMTVTVESTTEPSSTTPAPTTTTTTTTQEPSTTKSPVKIFSVDFLPQNQRKSNRIGQASARLKNSRDRDKYERPRKQKTTAVSTKSNEKVVTKLHKIERDQVPKKNRTRNGSKRPGYRKFSTSTSTELITETPVTSTTTMTQKPFWWLPKGWSIDESKEKPVLVRFWAQQPLPHDERARSHSSRQRMNSKMPTDNIFREITAPELESMLKK